MTDVVRSSSVHSAYIHEEIESKDSFENSQETLNRGSCGALQLLEDSSESGISDSSHASSVVLPKNSTIVISEDKIVDKSESEICDSSNDSNSENNSNYLNIHLKSQTSTLVNLSSSSTENRITVSVPQVLMGPNLDLEKSETNQKYNPSQVTLINIVQTPQKTCKTTENLDMSPDLFSDDEVITISKYSRVPKLDYKERYILKQDRKLFRQAQEILKGVVPPPSVTHFQMSPTQMLERIQENNQFFCTKEDQDVRRKAEDCVVESNSVEKIETLLLTKNGKEALQRPWPDILEERYHGLHFNRSKLSEDLEQLAMKLASRYIGSETQSSCTVFQSNRPTPSKNANRLRWVVKSPGKRLSHLARRRITFSSAALQSHTRQVTVDASRLKLLARVKSPTKRSPRKTPRKTPQKSPSKKIRTPTSSAKKRLSMQLRLMAEQMPNISKFNSTKRALFQSPDKSKPSTSGVMSINSSGAGNITGSPLKKRTSLKCVLFSSPSKESPSKKRKRTDSDTVHPSKFPRSISLQENAECNSAVKQTLSKVKSELALPVGSHRAELSVIHRKKLQWAIFEALKGRNILITHPQFKQFASVLARVTRRYLPNLSANVPRPECGTSEKMMRIARQHVHAVIQGKSVEEIIHDYELNKLKMAKPTGYVSIADAKKMDVSDAKSLSVLKDKINIHQQQAPKPEAKKFDRFAKVRKAINFDDNGSIR